MLYSSDNRKVAIIGCGAVGMSYAYALLNQGLCNELVLIDKNEALAKGEAMDLNHGLAFSSHKMTIYQGTYKDCYDADLAVICAGAPQNKGERRMDLLLRNAAILHDIVPRVVASGFKGIFIIATNPVDIMARLTQRLSNFPSDKVIGSGTTLDTARLRYILGNYFTVDPRNVHAYVIGEHGDSEFVPWSQALIATKPILKIVEEYPDRFNIDDLKNINEEVKTAAYKIIEAKRTTCYGIGMALARITRAIFGDENSVLTVSTLLNGEYDEKDVYIGNPTLINRNGASTKVRLVLTDEETKSFKNSCEYLKEM